MRALGIGLLFVAATASSVLAKSSNPAFLGIKMDDTPRGCTVGGVIRGTGAERAGVQSGDVLRAIDGISVDTCNALKALIISKPVGDTIKLDIQRGERVIVIRPRLGTRDEALSDWIGQPAPGFDLVNVRDKTDADLSTRRQQPMIVGVFDGTRCTGCNQLLSRVGRWAKKRDRGVDVVGVTPLMAHFGPQDALEALSPLARMLDVPLLAADIGDTVDDLSVAIDEDRVLFMVIDCKGIVRHLAPIVPNADDTDAMLDELYAAAEQARRK